MVAPTTYLDAALQVLREAQSPLTSDEITDEAIRRGLLLPNGKTPRRTMSACLYTWVKKNPSALRSVNEQILLGMYLLSGEKLNKYQCLYENCAILEEQRVNPCRVYTSPQPETVILNHVACNGNK